MVNEVSSNAVPRASYLDFEIGWGRASALSVQHEVVVSCPFSETRERSFRSIALDESTWKPCSPY